MRQVDWEKIRFHTSHVNPFASIRELRSQSFKNTSHFSSRPSLVLPLVPLPAVTPFPQVIGNATRCSTLPAALWTSCRKQCGPPYSYISLLASQWRHNHDSARKLATGRVNRFGSWGGGVVQINAAPRLDCSPSSWGFENLLGSCAH